MAAILPYRIAHLSDLHLTQNDNDARTELRRDRLTGMNARFRILVRSPPVSSADLILVTGDVTDRGDLRAWDRFWETLDRAGLRDRTLAVPGNHDVCNLSVRFPGTLTARTDRTKALDGLGRAAHHPTTLPWRYTVSDRIAVFGVDSNNSGNWSALTNAVGAFYSAQLKDLRRLLDESPAPIKIVALHHSPNIPGPRTEAKRRLSATSWMARTLHQISPARRREFRELCREHGVRIVIHGHLHRAEDRRIGGLHIVGTPATTQPQTSGPDTGMCKLAVYTVKGEPPRVYVTWHAVDLNTPAREGNRS